MSAPFHLLVVCTGNICRSPMAEVVLRDRFEAVGLGDQVVVESGATTTEELGNPVDLRAAATLTAQQYLVPDRAARQVGPADLARADLVLAMTAYHAKTLRRMARDDDTARRVVMYRRFDPAAPDGPEARLDVADPWYGGPADFVECLETIEAAADGIVAHVRSRLDGKQMNGVGA